MLTNLKFLGATALTLLLSALVINPAEANNRTEVQGNITNQVAPNPPGWRNLLYPNEAIYNVGTPVSVVTSIETNRVTVQSPTGQMMTYELTQTEMDRMNIATGSYVLVDENRNQILDVVHRGYIRNITGNIVTVQLDENGNNKLMRYGLSRRALGAMSLVPGQSLYVTRGRILANAPEPKVERQAYFSSMRTMTPMQSYEDTQAQQTQPPMQNTQPQQRDTFQQPQPQQRDTFQQQDDFQTQQNQTEPVRGMW